MALKKQFLAGLDPTFSTTSGSSTPIQSSTNSRMTRSMTKANGTPQPPTTPTTPTTPSGLSVLLKLISDLRRKDHLIPSTIHEEESTGDSVSTLPDYESSTQPTNLTNNPQFQLSNQPDSPQSSVPGSVCTYDSQPSSQNTIAEIAAAFGGRDHCLDLPRLEQAQATVLYPLLEQEVHRVDASQLSRHMWSHSKNMAFSNNGELYEWIRNNWEIDILSKTSMINTMKTTGTRNCYLCMRKIIEIFKAFHRGKN